MKLLPAFIFLIIVLSGCDKQPKQYALSSAHPLATKAGAAILETGGNAFDAAVTVSAVLAVVEPYSSGFGGGGFWLLHQTDNNRDIMIDGRERAPLNAHRDMYLDENSNVIAQKSLNGPLAAGIPGVPAALAHLAKKYGTMPLLKVLAPAITYAENGFPADKKLIQHIQARKVLLATTPATARIFLPNGKVPKLNQIIVQKDLAHTIRRFAEQGRDGFYRGKTAQQLIAASTAAGGIWTMNDLSSYTVVEREPIRFSYQDASIISASLPSSGGILLAEILNILSQIAPSTMETNESTHYLIEAMRLAYRDRALWLGDSDFVEVPQDRLTSLDYAKTLAQNIHPKKAGNNQELPDTKILIKESTKEGENTTHFSIIDATGNRVAATLSINYLFGSGFIAAGSGVLLNNEMDDFSVKPGVPNIYQLIGGTANAIEPGKRMLSSMSPTFIEHGHRVAALGTPGGSRIITMVLLGILNFIDGESAEKIVSFKRYHHQYLPDIVQHEKETFDLAMQANLRIREHKLELRSDYGNMHVVIYNRDTKQFDAAADPRGIGFAKIGYVNPNPREPSKTINITP